MLSDRLECQANVFFVLPSRSTQKFFWRGASSSSCLKFSLNVVERYMVFSLYYAALYGFWDFMTSGSKLKRNKKVVIHQKRM